MSTVQVLTTYKPTKQQPHRTQELVYVAAAKGAAAIRRAATALQRAAQAYQKLFLDTANPFPKKQEYKYYATHKDINL